jgi:deazaflavin-dependent oxidoreductase (nitroreductase family)
MAKIAQTPEWWVAPVNRIFTTMHRVGLPTPSFAQLLTVRGRKSGLPRTTPVSPFTVDGHRYVIGIFTGSDWIANARAHPDATLSTRRRTDSVRLVELPTDQRGPIMRAFPREVPRGTYVFIKAGIVTAPTSDAFEKGADKVAVFRIDPR